MLVSQAFGTSLPVPLGPVASDCEPCARRVLEATPRQLARGGGAALVAGACWLAQSARAGRQRIQRQLRERVCLGDSQGVRARHRWRPTYSSKPPKNFGVSPQPGNAHTCTLIYLHGFCGHAKEYLDNDSELSLPWRLGADYAPGLRVVLPTAPRLLQPWGEIRSSWYAYASRKRNGIGDAASLTLTRRRLGELLQSEVERLGDPRNVFLGGLSQGCTVALDLYLREAPRLSLGGFVGSVGFLPSDGLGFRGTDAALQELLKDSEQARRPVWLLGATDDTDDVPWTLVKRSLRPLSGQLPGLVLREVSGRGHHVDEWEADLLNEFLRKHASKAYF